MAIEKGSKVQTSANYDTNNGKHIASWVNNTTLEVIQVGHHGDPNSVVIGRNGAVTAVVPMSSLTSMDDPPKPTPAPEPVAPAPTQEEMEETMSDAELLDAMQDLLDAGSDEYLKYNMRLFGLPWQFSSYCDYRTYSKHKDSRARVGRKFIENIMLEAPVITLMPGEPWYLPAAKDKYGMSQSIVAALSGENSWNSLAQKLDEEAINEKLRYYDFRPAYYEYIRYVNIMCAVGAAFLDIGDELLDGKQLTMYDWKDYRWNAEKYSNALSNALTNKNTLDSFVGAIKSVGKDVANSLLESLQNAKDEVGDLLHWWDDTGEGIDNEGREEENAAMQELESILYQTNFVQFYVDPSSGFDEGGTNTTAESKLSQMMTSGSELLKEVAFIANSGGIDAKTIQQNAGNGLQALSNYTDTMLADTAGTVGGVLQRIMSSGASIIKGDNMIFPEIYQNSSYSKSYNISIDLRCPAGNRLAYYFNILVPLFHILGFAIPRQSTANTYGSPFIIKGFFPGVWSCNLGIVDQIQINKSPNGESWTVDGFPNEVKVTLSIKDLYSDLNISRAGDVSLFLANSSLIEFIATNCGVNLVTPQLANRVKMITAITEQLSTDSVRTIAQDIVSATEDTIYNLVGKIV